MLSLDKVFQIFEPVKETVSGRNILIELNILVNEKVMSEVVISLTISKIFMI